MTRYSWTIVFTLFAAGCGSPRTFHCTTSNACGGAAVCVRGACANADARCDTGLRFDNSAGSGLAGQCVTAESANPLGGACESDPQCTTGHCVTGVCCASSCTPDGSACGPDGTCGSDGHCHVASAGSACGVQSCRDGTVTAVALCDGQGSCLQPQTRACAPYQCNSQGTDCLHTCETSNDCTSPNVCKNGSCGLASNGTKCGADNECQSGHCTDGVCCNSVCSGGCVACNVLGKEGTCSPAPAGTADSHKLCTDQGPSSCGHDGKCDGAGGCEYYPAATVCAPGQCITGGYMSAGTCPGAGALCSGATSYSCGAYSCYLNNGAPQCFTSCGGCLSGGPYQSYCAPGYTCTKPTCGVNDQIYYCK